MKIVKNFRNKQTTLLITVVALFSFLTIISIIPVFDFPISTNLCENDVEDDSVGLKEIKSPKSSGFWVLNNITIDDTAPYEFGSITWQVANDTYDWCDGKGTLAEPYVIENVTIDAGSYGILIRDSNSAYFIIRNCTIFNPSDGPYPDVSGCIKMINASKGQLYSNNLYSNAGSIFKAGISLYQCAKIAIVNNTINGNGLISGNTYGIFMRYSNESLIFNNSAHSNYYTNIFLYEDCHWNNITSNIASYGNYSIANGGCGIALWTRSSNNKIANNIANNNIQYGIYLSVNCNNNTITGNNASDNNQHGIWLSTNCDYNTIAGNNVSCNKYYGLYVYLYSNNNTIDYNNVNRNKDVGIYLYRSNNNTVKRNIASNNTQYGIFAYYYCNNTVITGNNASNNLQQGICLYDNCKNNTITGNNASDNKQHGIYLTINCNNNTITENNASDNNYDGICLYDNCKNNTIVGNTVNNNRGFGICVSYSNNNTISGNIASDKNQYGIGLSTNCNYNTITGNNASDNVVYGIWLSTNCNYNTITGNNVSDNAQIGIYLNNNNDNKIANNTLHDNILKGIYISECINIIISGNVMFGCGIALSGSSYTCYSTHAIYTNNTVNKRIVYYYVDKEGLIASNFTKAGQIILINCNHSIISDSNVSQASNGIFLYISNNNTITGNNASYNYQGIYLEYSNNNTITGNIASYDNSFGIGLLFSNNNTISGNTASDNNYYGIYLIESNNNTIVANLISNNVNIGISIDVDCNGNLIYLNYFIGNGLHASDDGLYDRWDNGTIGNYWDTYIGVDANNDGIGDTPYTFIGGIAGAQDRFPIWNDWTYEYMMAFADAMGEAMARAVAEAVAKTIAEGGRVPPKQIEIPYLALIAFIGFMFIILGMLFIKRRKK